MTVLKMKGICKYFPGIIANENVDFDLNDGEIHSILGENGAGKSTLMNILSGLYRPDKGEILLHNKKTDILSPQDSAAMGIGMVHQHFRLSEKHTAYENIIIGYNKLPFIPNKNKLTEDITGIMDKFGLRVDLKSKIFELSISEEQKVEIVKVLINNPKIMIFDEPTAVLSSKETQQLFEVLVLLKRSGYSIIFISHKLDEVMKISDRITILSKGRSVDTFKTSEVTKEILAEKMIGRKILFNINKNPVHHNEDILNIKNATAYNDKGIKVLNDITLNVKKGEILGIAGVSGNGQVELAEVLFGLRKMVCDSYTVKGQIIIHPTPGNVMKHGVRLIPADRKSMGSAIGLNIPDNLILNRFKHFYFSSKFLLKSKTIKKKAVDSTVKFNIKHTDIKNPVRDLSGGNLQKVIVAREIESDPEILIAVYPTRGLDVGAIENLHKIFIEEQKLGKTIILISEELEEIFNISDRVAVIFKGEILKVWDRNTINENEIALAMGGVVND